MMNQEAQKLGEQIKRWIDPYSPTSVVAKCTDVLTLVDRLVALAHREPTTDIRDTDPNWVDPPCTFSEDSPTEASTPAGGTVARSEMQAQLDEVLMAAHAYENAFCMVGASPDLLSELIKQRETFLQRFTT